VFLGITRLGLVNFTLVGVSIMVVNKFVEK